jgi:hypothetical protein
MCLYASFVYVRVRVFCDMFSLHQLLKLFVFRWKYVNKVLYTNPPKEDYFAQFNTSSR